VTHFMRAAKIPALMLLASMVSFGGTITVTIVASIGPAPTSSSLQQYENNAEMALQNGDTTFGTINTPTYYSQVGGTINPLGFITTTYNSWLGTMNPASPYNNEFGNAVFFGLTAVASGGATFDMNDINFLLSGSPSTPLAPQLFDSNTVGFAGPGQTNEVFTSGNATTDDSAALTSFYTSGIFADTVVNDPTTVANVIATELEGPAAASYTVMGNATTGTEEITFNVPASVPEPSTFVFLGLGLAAMAGLRRRFASR